MARANRDRRRRRLALSIPSHSPQKRSKLLLCSVVSGTRAHECPPSVMLDSDWLKKKHQTNAINTPLRMNLLIWLDLSREPAPVHPGTSTSSDGIPYMVDTYKYQVLEIKTSRRFMRGDSGSGRRRGRRLIAWDDLELFCQHLPQYASNLSYHIAVISADSHSCH